MLKGGANSPQSLPWSVDLWEGGAHCFCTEGQVCLLNHCLRIDAKPCLLYESVSSLFNIVITGII